MDLSSNNIGGALPSEIGQLRRLKTLNIAMNMLSGSLPTEIFNISSLEVVILAHNSFSGEIPFSLLNISSLREVSLRNNDLHGSLPKELCLHLPQLEIFTISYNHFEGNIPRQIGNCTLLKELYLLGNSFTGQSKTHTDTLATLGYIAPEYGSEGIVSVKGDVYSYGILMLEIFTGKKPTDDIFTAGLNLRSWVSALMPHVTHIVDLNIIQQEGQQFDDIVPHMSTILELALHCCADLPEARISMMDVVASLNKIKMMFQPKARPKAT
ncbi:hypothetical protein L6164_002962 [Bauhinia variegata]|uniref:Uncharacterized protein n=1 Tax=Bauhinia variegata TaxID=167791 RepID=A0ACB9Q213_BAUVA|nr:hypothetical protein L6164_002962 [Bauhinia variegata]